MEPQTSIESTGIVFKEGQILAGRYCIVRLLGRGAIGSVLLVQDLQLENQTLALKVPHPHFTANSSTIERFRREITISRQLAHPGIVRIFQAAQLSDSTPFFTMEFVQGCSLDQLMMRYPGGRIPADEVEYLVRRTLDALSFAHEKGVIHRDLKPANILLSLDGSLKLSDFGIAHSLYDSQDFTRTGESIGTPIYMAPEQFSSGAVDARCDFYAVGITAFELLTGAPPFEEHSYVALARAHMNSPIPLHKLHERGAPEHLVRFIENCTQKDPRHRSANAREALDLLAEPEEQSVSTARERISVSVRSRYFARSAPAAFRVILNAVLMFLLLMWFFLVVDEPHSKTRMHHDIISARTALGVNLRPLERLLGLQELPHVRNEVLFFALRNYQEETMHALMNAGFDPKAPDPADPNGTPFVHEAALQNLDALQYATGMKGRNPWLKACPILTQVDKQGRNTLLLLVKRRRLQPIKWIVSAANCDFSTPDNSGDTPLLHAAKSGAWDIAAVLLNSRTIPLDTVRRDAAGDTAVHHIVLRAPLPVLKALLERRAYLDVRDSRGRTALMRLLAGERWGELQTPASLLLQSERSHLYAVDNRSRSIDWYAEQGGEQAQAILAEARRAAEYGDGNE